jgi:hypothetical protein
MHFSNVRIFEIIMYIWVVCFGHCVIYICKWFVNCVKFIFGLLSLVWIWHISSLFAFNLGMKCQFGWNALMKAHVGHVVHCKLLKLQDLHTFVVMIWYCVKDVRKEHFKVVHIKKIDVEKNVSIDEDTNLVQLLPRIMWHYLTST